MKTNTKFSKIRKNIKTRKTRKTRKNMIFKLKQTGGANFHYLISSHGDTHRVRRDTNILRSSIRGYNTDLKIHTYVENYGDELEEECGYELQTYLTHRRDNPRKPRCTPYLHINTQILNANLYVKASDPWISGILHVTNIGDPEIVETWNYRDHAINNGYTLDDALASILNHFETVVLKRNDASTNTIHVHVLTCM